MSIARLRFMAVALALAGSGAAITLLNAQGGNPPAWVVGDVFVAVGSGKYEVRSSAGTLKQTITSNVNPKKDVAGCWFDSQFNLYTADFNNTKVVKYNFATPHAASTFANTELQAPDGHSSSIVMAVNGDVYVGNAGNANGTGTRNILRYRSDGAFLGSFTPAVEDRGIDWMDLATDQRTMFYTSRGRLIKRFNVGTNTQLGNFADLTATTPTGEAYAIRLLPPFDGTGGLLVADNVNIKRLNGAGAVVATYDYDPAGSNNDEDTFQSLNLDPDGLHFWAGGNSTGRLYRFALNSPTPDLGPIQTDGKGALMGICVLGEPQTQVRPLALSNPSGSTQLIDITAPFGDPAATGENAFYSFSTWRLRIRVKAGQSVIAAVSFTPESDHDGLQYVRSRRLRLSLHESGQHREHAVRAVLQGSERVECPPFAGPVPLCVLPRQGRAGLHLARKLPVRRAVRGEFNRHPGRDHPESDEPADVRLQHYRALRQWREGQPAARARSRFDWREISSVSTRQPPSSTGRRSARAFQTTTAPCSGRPRLLAAGARRSSARTARVITAARPSRSSWTSRPGRSSMVCARATR